MKAMSLAVMAGVCWGVGELCTKMVLHTHKVGPVTAIAVRSTIALPLLWIAYLLVVQAWGMEPRAWWRTLDGGDIARLVLGSGLTAGAVAMICYYMALNLDDISRVKPVAFTLAPAVAVLLGWWLLKEPMTVRKGVAVAMILGGVVLLTGTGAPKPSAAAPQAGAAPAAPPH
jgi:uncharacterized membrane protein